MSAEHKAALAKGRVEGKAVRDYLEALRANKPTRGRKRTTDSVKRRLTAIESEIGAADAVRELRLVQERMDLEAELASSSGKSVDMGSLESEFVKVAKSYGQRTGVSYAAWRAVGVTPAVLKSAGIGRGA
jgi:hypothetical protein